MEFLSKGNHIFNNMFCPTLSCLLCHIYAIYPFVFILVVSHSHNQLFCLRGSQCNYPVCEFTITNINRKYIYDIADNISVYNVLLGTHFRSVIVEGILAFIYKKMSR